MKKGITGNIILQEIIENMKQAIIFNINQGPINSNIYYCSLNPGQAAGSAYYDVDPTDVTNKLTYGASMMGFSGSFKNLYVGIQSNLATTGDIIFTLQQAGASSGIHCHLVLTGDDGFHIINDIAHTTPFVATDLFALQIDATGLTGTVAGLTIAIEIDPS